MDIDNRSGGSGTYTVNDVAKILGVSVRTVYNFCDNMTYFKTLRIGKRILIHKESFNSWFNAGVPDAIPAGED